MSQDWRVGTNSDDYFRHRDKRIATEERRPVVRKASDLVGPGINSSATRITDFNDTLATFNGYYSADVGAAYAPNATDPFIGFVSMDESLGGRQVFTSLVSGNEYTRVFLRNPADESSISWGLWHSGDEGLAPATVYATTMISTLLPDTDATHLVMPVVEFSGEGSTFARASDKMNVLRPGVYTGYVWVHTVENITVDDVQVEHPNGDVQTYDILYAISGSTGVMVPLHFIATDGLGYVRVTITQSSGSTATGQFLRMNLTRIGDVS